MKRIRFFLTVPALTVLCGFIQLNAQTNLLTNPSFETVADNGISPASWRVEFPSAASGTISVGALEGTVCDGSRSLRIACTDGDQAATVSQTIQVTPGKRYNLSIWCYLDSFGENSGANAYFSYGFRDVNGGDLDIGNLDNVSSDGVTNRWREFKFTNVEVPAGAALIQVSVSTVHLLTIYFDRASVTEVPNLLANSSFETLNGTAPADWTLYNSSTTGSVSFESATDGVYAGGRSLKVNCTDGSGASASQIIPVIPGKQYSMSIWYNVQSFNESFGAFASFGYAFLDANGEQIGNSDRDLISADKQAGKWREFKRTDATAPANAVFIKVYLQTNNPITAYFDNAFLSEGPSPGLLANPGFETRNGAAPAGWTFFDTSTSGSVSFESVTNVVSENSWSLKIKCTDYSGASAYQIIPVTPGIHYDMSIWYNVQSFDQSLGAFAGFGYAFLDASGEQIGNTDRDLISADKQAYTWREFKRTNATAPANAASIKVYLQTNYPITVYFDNASLAVASSSGIKESVADANSKLSVRKENGNLIVASEPGRNIEVYSLLGAKLQSKVAGDSETVISGLPKGQVLLVRSGKTVAKVVL